MDCVLYQDNQTTLQSSPNAWVKWLAAWDEVARTRVIVALCCLGVLGNILNLLALTRRGLVAHLGHMEKSATAGLVALAISDLLFCLLHLPNAAIDVNKVNWITPDFMLYFNVYSTAVNNIFVVCSTWLTVVMAASRYLVICHPLHGRLIVDMKFAKASILAVFLGSILISLPRFWHSKVGCTELSLQQQKTYPTAAPIWYSHTSGVLPRTSPGWRGYVICYFILVVVIPVIVLIFCNVFLVRALHQSARMRNQFTNRDHPRSSNDSTRIVTLTLAIIVVANIVLVAPCEIFTFVDEIVQANVSAETSYTMHNFLVSVLNVLQVLSFSFNFLLYVIINAHFRRSMKEILVCRGAHPEHRTSNSESGVRYECVTANSNVQLASIPPRNATNGNHGNGSNKTRIVSLCSTCSDKIPANV